VGGGKEEPFAPRSLLFVQVSLRARSQEGKRKRKTKKEKRGQFVAQLKLLPQPSLRERNTTVEEERKKRKGMGSSDLQEAAKTSMTSTLPSALRRDPAVGKERGKKEERVTGGRGTLRPRQSPSGKRRERGTGVVEPISGAFILSFNSPYRDRRKKKRKRKKGERTVYLQLIYFLVTAWAS